MIIHTVDIRESGPDGLVAVLEPHDRNDRSLAVEADPIGAYPYRCAAVDCEAPAWGGVTIHRRHSRRYIEIVYLCAEDIERHRTGEALRFRVESNR